MQTGELLSSVKMADPRAAIQLLHGFHALEDGAWRWTKQEFAVALKPPPPLPDQAVELELRISIPPVSIERLGPLTLAAEINSVPVGEQTFRSHGQHVFRRPVSSEALEDDLARASFRLDKAFAPAESDGRELGLIVLSVALK